MAGLTVFQIWFSFIDPHDDGTGSMPEAEHVYQQSIRRLCAQQGWTYHFMVGWESIRQFRAQMLADVDSGALPWLLETPCEGVWEFFDRIPKAVSRHDLLRWLVLYAFGGMYLDLDVYWPGGPVPDVVLHAPILLVDEPQMETRAISNGMLLVRKPYSQFAASMIDGLLTRFATMPQRQVMASFGPLGLRKVLEQLPSQLQAQVLFLDGAQRDAILSKKVPKGWLVHAYSGLWSNKGTTKVRAARKLHQQPAAAAADD